MLSVFEPASPVMSLSNRILVGSSSTSPDRRWLNLWYPQIPEALFVMWLEEQLPSSAQQKKTKYPIHLSSQTTSSDDKQEKYHFHCKKHHRRCCNYIKPSLSFKICKRYLKSFLIEVSQEYTEDQSQKALAFCDSLHRNFWFNRCRVQNQIESSVKSICSVGYHYHMAIPYPTYDLAACLHKFENVVAKNTLKWAKFV